VTSPSPSSIASTSATTSCWSTSARSLTISPSAGATCSTRSMRYSSTT
jgi:hypothetical protein